MKHKALLPIVGSQSVMLTNSGKDRSVLVYLSTKPIMADNGALSVQIADLHLRASDAVILEIFPGRFPELNKNGLSCPSDTDIYVVIVPDGGEDLSTVYLSVSATMLRRS